jgi:hypothetical protein
MYFHDMSFARNKQKDGAANMAPDFVCPHWEQESCSCLQVCDGIFLPVDSHRSVYCLTSQYTLCGQYGQSAGQNEQTGQPASNRRRSARVPCHYIFRFAELTGSHQVPSIREDDAWTVDVSTHGIRFATRQMLPPETALQFEVVKGPGKKPVSGAGRVIWSKAVESSHLFHAGIVFTEHPHALASGARPSAPALNLP